uniref:Uncharacterized protein n=1 Tax=Haptolina ericina TaxID=156174 RepID=A0A7S3EXH3_9EUKA
MERLRADLNKVYAKLPKVPQKSKRILNDHDIMNPPPKRACVDNDIHLPPVASPVPTEGTELKGELDLETDALDFSIDDIVSGLLGADGELNSDCLNLVNAT